MMPGSGASLTRVVCDALVDQGRTIDGDPVGYRCVAPATHHIAFTLEDSDGSATEEVADLCPLCHAMVREETGRVTLTPARERTMQLSGGASMKMKRVYICHPFSADPEGNVRAIREVCRRVVGIGHNPVPPQLYLPQFMDDATERERAMALCLDLVGACDEVWIFRRGAALTAGQLAEQGEALRLGKVLCNITEDARGTWDFDYELP
jgi:hypothetical protein